MAVLLIGTARIVVCRYKADIRARKQYFGVIAGFEVVSSETAHVLYDDGANIVFFRLRDKALPIRSVKIRAAIAIIHKELYVCKAVVICVLLQNGLLIFNAVASPCDSA